MILLTNGDSWTQGDSPSQTLNWNATKTLDWYDIVPHFGNALMSPDNRIFKSEKNTRISYKFYDSEVWPKVLGRKLGLKTWNSGRLGADNRKIVETTVYSVKYLQDLGHKDIFVVIGWTSMFRQKTFVLKTREDGSSFITNDTLRPTEMDKSLILKDQHYTSHFLHDILYLQSFLESQNIKYLFFNAFDYVQPKNDQALNYINVNNWYGKCLDKGHMKQYILDENNLEEWNDKKWFIGSHPSDLGHILWGNHLGDYIKDNNVV